MQIAYGTQVIYPHGPNVGFVWDHIGPEMEYSSPGLVLESVLEYRNAVLGLVLEYRPAVLVLGLDLRLSVCTRTRLVLGEGCTR